MTTNKRPLSALKMPGMLLLLIQFCFNCEDHFSECVERHAYTTYDKFIKLQGGENANNAFWSVKVSWCLHYMRLEQIDTTIIFSFSADMLTSMVKFTT